MLMIWFFLVKPRSMTVTLFVSLERLAQAGLYNAIRELLQDE